MSRPKNVPECQRQHYAHRRSCRPAPFAEASLEFRPGLNVIVGPNNIGKTAIVDGLRALLAGADDPYPRFTCEDIHIPSGGTAARSPQVEAQRGKREAILVMG